MDIKIVFLDEYSINDADLTPIKSLGAYTGYETTAPEQIVERSKGFDVVITNKCPMTADVITQLPDLKLICVAATGVNNIDLAAAEKAGVAVMNAKAYSTDAVAEQTLGMAISLLRQFTFFNDYVKSGKYSAADRLFNYERPTFQLRGKHWGIIGLGNIGKRVAELAMAFGCEVSYHSTSGRNDNKEYPQKSLDQLLIDSDIISVHAPLNSDTHNLLDYHQMSLMKRGAILINSARGSIVNEEGLARALNDNLILGSATDVYSTEPMPADNPLTKVKDKHKLLLTPHSAWATKESLQILIGKITDNIKEFYKDK